MIQSNVSFVSSSILVAIMLYLNNTIKDTHEIIGTDSWNKCTNKEE